LRDIIRPLVGVLAFFFFVLAALALAISALAGPAERRWRRTRILAAIVGVIEAVLVFGGYREAHYWDGWTLQPEFAEQDLAGTWKSEDGWMNLRPDRTFASNTVPEGKWELHNGYFVWTTGNEWAVLRHEGRLALVKIPGGDIVGSDPDGWNLGLAFEKQR